MADNTNNRLTTDGISHLWQRIKLLVSNNVSGKVDKVSGKGLSSNDYTNEEKTKLAGIATGAQKNVQPDWNASTGDGSILNKPTIPSKVSQLTNDKSYQTADEVSIAIAERARGGYKAVEALPTTGEVGYMYLVPNPTASDKNAKSEYVWLEDSESWELIGNGSVDLTNYAKKSEIPSKVSQLSNDSGYVDATGVRNVIKSDLNYNTTSTVANKVLTNITETNGVIAPTYTDVTTMIPAIDNDTIDSICTL